MNHDLALYRLAAREIKDVYDGQCFDEYSTEWNSSICDYNGRNIQVLAVGGSDELIDWLWNVTLLSWGGVKLCSYLSAKRILKGFTRLTGIPLLVAGHSKSGPTALYLADRLNADYCVAFAPARGFRRAKVMHNATIVLTEQDPVPKIGFLSFTHPNCKKYYVRSDGLNGHKIDYFLKNLSHRSKKHEKDS